MFKGLIEVREGKGFLVNHDIQEKEFLSK